jgi:hypothetical protein
MIEQPPSSSVPPPGAPADSVAGRFAASMLDPGDATEVASPVARASERSLSSTLLPVVGLYFLTVASIYAGMRILQSDERGRGIGILLALSGLAFALISFSSGVSSLGIALMSINAFVLWVLFASSPARSR